MAACLSNSGANGMGYEIENPCVSGTNDYLLTSQIDGQMYISWNGNYGTVNFTDNSDNKVYSLAIGPGGTLNRNIG